MSNRNEKFSYTEMKNLLQFTTNARKFHRQPQFTLQLACEDHVFFVWVDLAFFMRAAASKKCDQAIRLVCPHFCKLRSVSNLTNRNRMELSL